MARRKKMGRRKNGVKNIHPSLTGMGAGLTVLRYLNEANNPETTVTGALKTGDYTGAVKRLAVYSEALVRNDLGRKVLVSSVGIATVGALVRKQFPNLKIGGSKYYFRP